ncbi:MAG: hypothetical protein HQL56_08455 [Magnetococcales bacterium]|nr:hypothetical protein [Magnetococcales bacterium]
MNDFVCSSPPFMVSFRALLRNQYVSMLRVPRKIEFEMVVQVKEGILDCIYPNSDVTVFVIGDGVSDKRLTYNMHRLFVTMGERYRRYRVYGFICSPKMIGQSFEGKTITSGWNVSYNNEELFYHAVSWDELVEVENRIAQIHQEDPDRRFMFLIDIDGTYLAPLADFDAVIKPAREEAMFRFCGEWFDAPFFDGSDEHKQKMRESYQQASGSAFCSQFGGDEDVNMLVAIGLYSGLIDVDDPFLSGISHVGMTCPTDYLNYMLAQIENDRKKRIQFSRLASLYAQCAKAIHLGSPTSFEAFRVKEEEVLRKLGIEQRLKLNLRIARLIRDMAERNEVVSIGLSDRPNASMGVRCWPERNRGFVTEPHPTSLVRTPLKME